VTILAWVVIGLLVTRAAYVMRMRPILHKLHAKLDAILAGQSEIKAAIAAITAQELKLMAAIDDIQADVTAEDTIAASVITLLQGLSAQIATAGVDPVKLAAVRSDIQTHTQALAAAVLANTPAPVPGAATITPAAAGAAAAKAATS
jgi:hypothetical protein